VVEGDLPGLLGEPRGFAPRTEEEAVHNPLELLGFASLNPTYGMRRNPFKKFLKGSGEALL